MKVVRLGVLIVMIILFVFTISYKPKVINPDTVCEVDNDCAFARTACCPGSGDFISVNLETAERIDGVMSERCANSVCAPFDVEEITGVGIITKPACIKEECSHRNEKNCNAICEYHENGDRPPYPAYLDYSATVLNTTVGDLVVSCNC